MVAIGYADGFFRSLSSANNHRGTHVSIRGQHVPVIGRVSTDMIGVDITDLPEPPKPGEMAEILGKTISVDDHADVGVVTMASARGATQSKMTFWSGSDESVFSNRGATAFQTP